MIARKSTHSQLKAIAATLDSVTAPLAGASVRLERVARERRLADAGRDARRKVAPALGRGAWPSEPQLPVSELYGLAMGPELP